MTLSILRIQENSAHTESPSKTETVNELSIFANKPAQKLTKHCDDAIYPVTPTNTPPRVTNQIQSCKPSTSPNGAGKEEEWTLVFIPVFSDKNSRSILREKKEHRDSPTRRELFQHCLVTRGNHGTTVTLLIEVNRTLISSRADLHARCHITKSCLCSVKAIRDLELLNSM